MALENKPMDRRLEMMANVDQGSVKSVIMDIHKINADDDLKTNEFKDFKREPIQLLINTFGGSVYDGLALINTIQQSKTEVHGICIGSAFSMGLFILIVCHKRYMYKYSTLMYHEILNSVTGKLNKIKQNLDEGTRLQKIVDDIILNKSNIKSEQLDNIKAQQKDWYITPEEALSLNLIDEIK